MDTWLTPILVLVLLVLAPVWVVTGLLGVGRWWRGDSRLPRAQMRGGRPGLRPGLVAPILRIVLGGAVITAFVLVVCALQALGRSFAHGAAPRAAAREHLAPSARTTPP